MCCWASTGEKWKDCKDNRADIGADKTVRARATWRLIGEWLFLRFFWFLGESRKLIDATSLESLTVGAASITNLKHYATKSFYNSEQSLAIQFQSRSPRTQRLNYKFKFALSFSWPSIIHWASAIWRHLSLHRAQVVNRHTQESWIERERNNK